MKVTITDTFTKSLEKIINRQRWYWKTLDFLRYDMPRFFKNVWLFRKDLYNYRWYGYNGMLGFMNTSLGDMSKNMESRGHEVESSRNKKITKMVEVKYILERFMEEDFIELAEKELGKLPHKPLEFEPCEDNPNYSRMVDNETEEEKTHRSNVYKRAREIEKEMWNKLWDIFKGQDYDKFKNPPEDMTDHNEQYNHWQEQFDGSGLRGWWD
jgi:hypothetical protein